MMICSCVTQLGFLGTRCNKFNIFNLIWKKCKYFKKQCNRTKKQYFKALVLHSFFHIMFWCRKSKVDDVIFSSKNRTEDLLVARNEIVSSYYYFFPFFCARDFSKTARPISIKFKDVIDSGLNLIGIVLYSWRYIRFWDFSNFYMGILSSVVLLNYKRY